MPPGAAPQVALGIRQKTCFDSERGVLGTAVDPLFAQNHFIYLYYTFKKFGVCDRNTPTAPVNRVSRFVLPDTNVIDPATETVLIDNIPSPDGIHNAGDLGFGQDGYLYASVGDGGCDFRGDSGCSLLNDAARDLAGLSGKLLRVTRDGASPPGNPFMAGPDVPCRLTGSTNPHEALHRDLRQRPPQPFPVRIRPGQHTAQHQRRRRGQVGGGRPRRAGGRLRLERARGTVRARLAHELRPPAGRHDQPDPLLRPPLRLHLDHLGFVRAGRGVARRSTTARTCTETSCAESSSS